MTSPTIPNTLKRLAKQLFAEELPRDEFIQSLVTPREYPVAVVWVRDRPQQAPFDTLLRPKWMPEYVDLVPFAQRPGQHELHTQGAFYCVDPSSVFMAQSLTAVSQAHTVLDVCASPGGKSVMAWRALKPKQLWCNEVIGKRVGALISNLKRCGVSPVSVISVDPIRLADSAAQAADVVLVDAPCSGQSLVAKGKPSPGCFHPATINMNANRQRKILANSATTVKPGGWLAYMTCTYSLKENERNVEWLLKQRPELTPQVVNTISDYQSRYTEIPCYRLWPMAGEGAGAFMAVLRNSGGATDVKSGHGSLLNVPVRWNCTPQ